MIDWDAALQGATDLVGIWPTIWLVILGLIIGMIFGVLPGAGAGAALAMAMPFTLYMGFLPGLIFLLAIFTGNGFGGAIPAILLNVPGGASAVATTFDGYPMTQQGKHNEALGLALIASSIGTAIGYVALFLTVGFLGTMVLKLGPSEMFVIILWGICLIAALSGRDLSRGLLAGAFGLLIGTLGMSARGTMRGTLGRTELLDGIPTVAAIMGLFLGTLISTIGHRGFVVDSRYDRSLSFTKLWSGVRQAASLPRPIIRGGLIGTWIGAVPGVGGTVACLISYDAERRRSQDPSRFGKGAPEGLVAAESANNSSEGGSLGTLLVLGIPGGTGTAVLLGAMAMHGVQGGPGFISDHMSTVYTVIYANWLQALLLIPLGLVFTYFAAGIVKVPMRILTPSCLAFAIVAGFLVNGSQLGAITVTVFAVMGYFMTRFKYPVPAAAVGIILGRDAEGELYRSWQLSGGNIGWLLDHPITIAFLVLLVFSLAGPRLVRRRRSKDHERPEMAMHA